MNERSLVGQIRSVMAPANPVPTSAYDYDQHLELDMAARIESLRAADPIGYAQRQRPDSSREHAGLRRAGLRRAGGRGTRTAIWRVAAPALSGLAVAAVVVSLALAGGSAAKHASTRPAGSSGGGTLPRFYVTINGVPPHATVVLHSSQTGQTLSSRRVPGFAAEFATITAARSERVFFFVARQHGDFGRPVTVLYRLIVANNGRSMSLKAVSGDLNLEPAEVIDGIALSPDGRNLAVAGHVLSKGGRPEAQLVVAPTNNAPAPLYTTRDPGFISDPVWTSDEDLAFLWQDHLTGTTLDYTGRTQVRLLNTAAGGSNLLSSRVLTTASHQLGFIESAFAAPGRGPIIASAARDIPALGLHGTATVRLVAISPVTGKVIKVFAMQGIHYDGALGRDYADNYDRVLGLDSSGKHALVDAPNFGVLSGGKFTPLPTGLSKVDAAAW